MDAIVEKLDRKLRSWKPETADEVRRYVARIIELADHDALDVARSPEVEQEVLDILDESASR
jgi:hypothetical protein